LLALAREPGAELTLEDIAAWCDCPASTIHRIEQSALQKSRWHPQNPALRRAMLAAMKSTKQKPSAGYQPQYGLIVVCTDEADQKRKFEMLKKRGLKVKIVVV
jgi:hypothetical protein